MTKRLRASSTRKRKLRFWGSLAIQARRPPDKFLDSFEGDETYRREYIVTRPWRLGPYLLDCGDRIFADFLSGTVYALPRGSAPTQETERAWRQRVHEDSVLAGPRCVYVTWFLDALHLEDLRDVEFELRDFEHEPDPELAMNDFYLKDARSHLYDPVQINEEIDAVLQPAKCDDWEAEATQE